VWPVETLPLEWRDKVLECHYHSTVSWDAPTKDNRWAREYQWRLVLHWSFYLRTPETVQLPTGQWMTRRSHLVEIDEVEGGVTTIALIYGRWIRLVQGGRRLNYSCLDRGQEFAGLYMSSYLTRCIPPDRRG